MGRGGDPGEELDWEMICINMVLVLIDIWLVIM